ncbi:hypothetical protein BDD14_3893 [Edaphobacter modestus]|uniref:Uncharacterized protein n=1 Tax=Edaphobacter modestus TaxID=388466 RepID=A0A4Q7YX78_9BACT|nr:hypothetical protein BDD14_3893 [Edaphobacter modestus]
MNFALRNRIVRLASLPPHAKAVVTGLNLLHPNLLEKVLFARGCVRSCHNAGIKIIGK